MGKRRRIAKPKPQIKQDKLVYDPSLSKADVPSSKELSSEYYNDEIDKYHEEKFESLMAKGVELDSDEEPYDSADEVMPLDIEDEDDGDDDEDDDDEEDEGEEDHNMEEIGEEDDQLSMGSDLEDRVEDGLPSDMAWGNWKKIFYNTDYRESTKKVKKTKEELEAAAEDEEEEAQNVQRRLAKALNEEDYGLDFIQEFAVKPSEETPSASDQKIVQDLNKMSDKEKRKLLKKESPELMELIQDLKQKLAEVKNELEPLMKMVKDGIIPKGKGSAYLQCKYQLYLNYCTNISYYLQLKAKRIPITGHPVIQRLFVYRSLINKLADVDARLAPEISLLLSEDAQKKLSEGKVQFNQPKPSKKAAVKRPAVDADEDSDLDEEAALNYYRMMENNLLEKKKLGAEKKTEEASEELDPNEKRGITYQIAKNKGLTPKRKKIDRNPRVKHREKYRRAKIRRKGQVREVRTEVVRYSGELSGIRAGVKKSIKLKI
ncbi:hypothetical protein GDO81_014163 [Engystomops pustulosus]|uniref:Sas10 C-terminal domain-containing protein n=1 Tax=Engystomops pustulosus TaxID=76066 RepID=A0AAV7B8C4_ENGPU|nr:hypothetical protein GDO81_014163 [Engystomops pustulosus]